MVKVLEVEEWERVMLVLVGLRKSVDGGAVSEG